ncbi:MAG: glutathione S-transferase family protein [Pikeienuella sp.]
MRRLFHLPLSPFCRKVRLVLGERQLEVELVEERPWDRRIDFLRMNPAGAVPVYHDEDGAVMSDSNAICEYLEETCAAPRLMPSDSIDRAEVRRLVGWFDGKFHNEVTANLVYERVNKRLMKAGYPDSACIKAGARNIKYHMEYIGWLIETRKWIAGDDLSLADFAAAAHLSCLDYCGDVPWEISEPAKEWYARIKSRPAFRPLLADHIPGFPPRSHYADLDF